MSLRLVFWCAAFAACLLDIVSKRVAFAIWDGTAGAVVLPGVLAIRCGRNQGGVFGLFQGHSGLFIFFSLVAIIVIVLMWEKARPRSILVNISVGMVFAGAVGNLYDRVRFGFVRDFIDLHLGQTYHWPTFNLADAFICIGALVFAICAGKKKASE